MLVVTIFLHSLRHDTLRLYDRLVFALSNIEKYQIAAVEFVFTRMSSSVLAEAARYHNPNARSVGWFYCQPSVLRVSG